MTALRTKVGYLTELKKELAALKDPQRALLLARYFKTGKGGYAEGDRFLGIRVPVQRRLAKKYGDLNLKDLERLLASRTHEFRLTALFILTSRFRAASEAEKRELADFYLKHTQSINNWDLVDCSAPLVLGAYLFNKNKTALNKLARSKNLWERRIAILSTFYFIKYDSFDETLKIAEILLEDKHDLIHKAVGWMLREVGKKNLGVEEAFLKKFYRRMPRTMLRYAIEKFNPASRRFYLG